MNRGFVYVLSVLLATAQLGAGLAWADPTAWETARDAAFPNGRVYFIMGNLEERTAEKEYVRFFEIARWLSSNGYEPVVLPNARLVDIRAAVMNPETTGIIYSSHGSPDGYLKDAYKEYLPESIFYDGAGAKFKFFALSACYGNVCTNRYSFPSGSTPWSWEGTTDSDALFRFLKGEKFDQALAAKTTDLKAKCKFAALPVSEP